MLGFWELTGQLGAVIITASVVVSLVLAKVFHHKEEAHYSRKREWQ